MAGRQILQLRGIRHHYDKVPALSGVDFDLYEGEIHAITGDHRSGKTTLVRLITGDLRPQHGEIWIRGQKISQLKHRSAMDFRIGVVSQTSHSFPNLSAVDNVFAGRYRRGYIGRRIRNEMERECVRLLDFLGLSIDIRKPIGRLPYQAQQLIQVARALAIGTEVVIFDEISQRLIPIELESLFRVIRRVRDSGTAVIYATSTIDEVFRIADRVTVLRDGHRRGTETVEKVDRSRLVNLAFSFAVENDSQLDDRHKVLLLNQYDESVMNDLPIGMVLLSPNHKIFFANDAALKIMNMESGAVLGSSISDLLLADQGAVQEILGAIERGERYTNAGVSLLNDRKIKFTTYPLKDRENSTVGTTALIEDVSIDYVTREYLMRAEKAASTAELASGVAHEINNPLGIIKNYLLLLKSKPLDVEGKDYLGHVASELNRIVEIVGSLLSFSRVNRSPFQRVVLSDVADEILILLNHKLKQKRVTVKRKYGKNESPILGDENKMKQLLMNLINNSIEAVLDGGEIDVEIRNLDQDDYVEVVITDNGNGIPPDIQPEVFNPFFSTKMNKTNTGLGLSICQHIVESHRGLVTFQSTPGRSTSFSVKLPVYAGRIDTSSDEGRIDEGRSVASG